MTLRERIERIVPQGETIRREWKMANHDCDGKINIHTRDYIVNDMVAWVAYHVEHRGCEVNIKDGWIGMFKGESVCEVFLSAIQDHKVA